MTATAKVTSIHEDIDADRVDPSILHLTVGEQREKVSKRIEAVNAETMRNADEERSLLGRLDAIRSANARLDAEREELIAIDDSLGEQERSLERLLLRRAGR